MYLYIEWEVRRDEEGVEGVEGVRGGAGEAGHLQGWNRLRPVQVLLSTRPNPDVKSASGAV